jgi:hypothetical protein
VSLRWTIGRALVALTLEIEPELCRAVAAVGEDLQRVIDGSRSRVTPVVVADVRRVGRQDFSRTIASLQAAELEENRRSAELYEQTRRLLAELLRRLQAHEWQLIVLPNGNQPGEPLVGDQLAALTIDDIDIRRAGRFDALERSYVILGGQHFRAWVETEPSTRPVSDRGQSARVILAPLEETSASKADVAAAPRKPGRPPRFDAKERMRRDLKRMPDGSRGLFDEKSNPIGHKQFKNRYGAARNTCAKYLRELLSESQKPDDHN